MPYDDYRHSQEAKERELMIIWKCDSCGAEREDAPGWNEGGQCSCGGEFQEVGESWT